MKTELKKKYRVNIGLEVHVQLLTKSKMFCGCSTKFGESPNTNVCPVCLGLPGVLPVINQKAVEFTLLTSLALHCHINPSCRFARKNYYYPDLPKNYQISQYEEPFGVEGWLEIEVEGKVKKIRIERVHLEEDTGKLIHGKDTQDPEDKEASFVDYNRAGIPLMEIVSSPEIASPQEANEYLLALRRILRWLRVSDCNMEEGSLRCDANISVSLEEGRMGVKTEIKNMNSFKEIREALGWEIERQINLLEEGKEVVQETRLWDPKLKKTFSMRGKEEAHDYRYFPEPDLVPIEVDKEWIEKIKKNLPELPLERKKRLIEAYGLPSYDASILTEERELSDYFEECLKFYPHPKEVSNWLMGEFLRLLKEDKKTIEEIKVTPQGLGELLSLVKRGVITQNIAKDIFEKMFRTGERAAKIVKEEKLEQIGEEEVLEKIVEEVLQENKKAVEDYRKGKKQALGFLVGQVMKKTKGKANPLLVNKLLREKL